MRSRPVLLKILRAAFGDQVNRQAGSVRRDDGARLAHRFDALKQLALDFQIFGDGLDDPIHLPHQARLSSKIPGRDQPRGFRREKSGRARFFRGFEARQHDAIAHRRAFERQPLAFFIRSQFRRNDIEQVTRDAGVGQVRRDARAHRAGSQHR